MPNEANATTETAAEYSQCRLTGPSLSVTRVRATTCQIGLHALFFKGVDIPGYQLAPNTG